MNTKRVKELWETEEIRVLILISLLIQAWLTFLAPRRKNCAKATLQALLWALLWVLYLLADVIAMYIIGLISNNRCHHYAQSTELLALWAPFLLLHLGGPDTITALALEDNELWRRHALQLGTQVSVTVLVFYRSLQQSNRLWIPTVLMFIDGFIKYFERTCALFYASRDNFKNSMMTNPEAGPNFARLMDEYYSATCAHIPVDFEDTGDGKRGAGGEQQNGSIAKVHVPKPKDPNDKLVLYANWFYDKFKPFLAEELLSMEDREICRNFFLHEQPTSADEHIRLEKQSGAEHSSHLMTEIIQIELNLIYDAFYTKSFLLWKKQGLFRIVCFFLVLVSLVLFSVTWDLKQHKTDAIITFILFFGAIALDISAAIMFVSSDWWVIFTYVGKRSDCQKRIMGKMLSCSKQARKLISFLRQPPRSRRWSQTISQYNLLKYCFWTRPLLFGLSCKLHIRDIFIRHSYVEVKKDYEEKLMSFIIKEIWKKAEKAHDTEVAKDVFSARGNLVLEDDYYLLSECLSPWTTDIDYNESLMIWHLATDICYWRTGDISNGTNEYLGYSKKLSDYMLYLVIWQQSLLSSVVGRSKVRFQDTCAAAQKFMGNYNPIDISWWKPKKSCCGRPSRLKEFSSLLRRGSKAFTNIAYLEKADKSNSVLFDACRLANQLEMFGEHQWEITSKVWVELLCYAAVHCSPRYHIAQLSKGGELITLVWLVMAHLGLGEQFLQHKGYGWTRLVIGK